MRSFLVVFAIGLAALAVVGLTQRSSVEYTLGVNPALAAATLAPGDRVCQAPIRPPTGTTFDAVGFRVTGFREPGPEVEVTVLDDDTGERLGSGTLRGGYADTDVVKTERVVPVGRIDSSAPLRVCLTNDGTQPVTPVGQAGVASPSTEAMVGGKAIANDLTLRLHGPDRSLLARFPQFADRASVFRAGAVRPVTYLILALAVLVGAPFVLARGLRRI
jgi:hypothetical protein